MFPDGRQPQTEAPHRRKHAGCPRFSLLVAAALLSTLAFAQTETQITSDPVKRVAKHVACQCGSCSEDANCMMSAGQCGFCKPARTKIYRMQQAGMDDQKILDSFIQEFGQKIYRGDPNAFGWIVPYAALALGTVLIIWFVKRSYRPKPATVGDLGKYHDQIEKDLAHLD
jgi:cytochrome c-type biogenesis protein CcmH/NrfF